MKRSIWVPIAALAVVASAEASDPPRPWSSLSFDEAVARSKQREQVLLVYATATWCPPCKMMEQTTWKDRDVRQWFDAHGIALKVDVDHERAIAMKLKVEAMPTLIAFRDGEEFDRVVGYRSGEALIEWLEGVRKGKREIDRLLEAAGDRVGPDGRVDVNARMDLARSLADRGVYEAAAEEYIWLWRNMLDHAPSMYGVRLSFMVSDMERLAEQDEAAQNAFRGLRAGYTARIESGKATRDEVVDWVRLASVVDEEESLLEWFDANKDDADGLRMLRLAERELSELLVEAGRWAEVARLYVNPVERTRQSMAAAREADRFMGDEARERVHRTMVRLKREQLARMYAVLLAADRDDEAEEIAQILLEFDDSTASRGALVTTALEAGQARKRHLQWIDEAEAMGASAPRARQRVTDAVAHGGK